MELCTRFDLVRDAYALANANAGLVRADAKGRALSESGLLWQNYLDRIRGARGDAARVGLAGQLAAAAFRGAFPIEVRADAASFFANDLIDRDARITVRPQRPNALIAAIPTYSVTPWAEGWTARYGEDAGVAVPYRKGSSDTQLVDGSVSEELRPMTMFRADAIEFIGDREQAAMAGVDFNSQAEQTRRALEAHYKAHNTGLLSGVTGFAGYSLGTLPGILRRTAASTFGTTAVDTALPEFKAAIDLIPEVSNGTMPAPDTMLCTQRFLNRIGSYLAFAQGGTEFSDRLVRDLLTSKGISNVVIANELQNYGGALIDGVVFFNSANQDSLRQVVGLRPAPVKTFESGANLSMQTAYLSGFGGLYARLAGSVLVWSVTVSAA